MDVTRLLGVILLAIGVVIIAAGASFSYAGAAGADNYCNDPEPAPCYGRDARSSDLSATGSGYTIGGFAVIGLATVLFVVAALVNRNQA